MICISLYFVWKINIKQPSDTTHSRCMTSKSTKVPDKNNKHVFLSSYKNTHNNNPTFCTQKIQTPLPVDECNQISSRREYTISSKQERPRGIFPQALISSRAIRKDSMPACPRTSTDCKFCAKLKRHLKCTCTLDWNLSPPHASTVEWHIYFPCK